MLTEMFDAIREARGGRLLAAFGWPDASGEADSADPAAPVAETGGREETELPDPATVVARWSAGPVPTADDRWSSRSAHAAGSKLFVGTIDGVVVGLAAGTVRRGHGRIECCYVEPGARAIGLGGDMTAALLEWFADEGCTDVDALSLPGDRTTKQLLETAGFKTRLLVLHRPLGDRGLDRQGDRHRTE